jgi:CelD/BcsL family acetyltransferase involved in cellulose biosynthesis
LGIAGAVPAPTGAAPPMRLSAELRTDLQQPSAAWDAIAEEWDALADRVGADPFARPGWFAAHHRAFGAGALAVLTIRRDGALAALAPLERQRGRLASATSWHTPFYTPLADSPEALAALADALVARARPQLELSFIVDGTPAMEALRAAAARCRSRAYVLERCPYVVLDGDVNTYEQRLTGKRRANLRRLRRRLEDRGRVEVTVHGGADELDLLLDEGFAVEASGWKGAEGTGTAILEEPATERFYRDVAAWASGRGWLRLAFLRLDGRALAFDFAIEAGGVHYLLKTGYVAEERSAAPGVLLRRAMLARAFDEGLRRYEFLGDHVGWKREWTDDTHAAMRLTAFTATPAGRVGWIAWAYARPALRRLQAALRR